MRPSRAAALLAIARAVELGEDTDAAYLALVQRVDPLLRGSARRILRDAYVDALLSTNIKRGDDANRHVMRIAYLIVAGVPPAPAITDDVAAVEAAYAAAHQGKKLPASIRWPSVVLGVVLAIAGAALCFTLIRTFGPPRFHDASERPMPPPRGGGKIQPKSPALTRALAEDLPDFLIQLDHLSRSRLAGAPAADLAKGEAAIDEAGKRVLTADVKAGLGEGASARLEKLLAAAREAAAGHGHDAPGGASEALMEATGAFDDELAAAGLGYFLDGDVITDTRTGHRLVILYSFTVESESRYGSGTATIRALDLRRLDHLNWTHALLGFTRPHLREALVLLDQVDEQLVSYVLPGLGEGAGIALFDEDEDGEVPAPPSRAAVERRAGELVRAEYGATPGLDEKRAQKMGSLLSRRRALVEGWQRMLSARRIVLQMPGKLRLDGEYASSLSGVVPRSELSELVSIDEEIGDQGYLDAYARLRDVLVDSVERHEVQHRLDFARPDGLPMPRALAAYVGDAPPGIDEEHRFASQVRAELSAYLAELSRDTRTTKVNLTMIARFLFKRRMAGVAECYAALVIFEGLATELSLPRKAAFVQAGQIDRGAVAELYLALTDTPPADLRAAAARLWEKLFGDKLPEMHLLTPPAGAR